MHDHYIRWHQEIGKHCDLKKEGRFLSIMF